MPLGAYRFRKNFEDFSGDVLQGQNKLRRPEFDGFFGHSENHATLFVLNNGPRPVFIHVGEADGPVLAHARQDDTDAFSRATLATESNKTSTAGRQFHTFGP